MNILRIFDRRRIFLVRCGTVLAVLDGHWQELLEGFGGFGFLGGNGEELEVMEDFAGQFVAVDLLDGFGDLVGQFLLQPNHGGMQAGDALLGQLAEKYARRNHDDEKNQRHRNNGRTLANLTLDLGLIKFAFCHVHGRLEVKHSLANKGVKFGHLTEDALVHRCEHAGQKNAENNRIQFRPNQIDGGTEEDDGET